MNYDTLLETYSISDLLELNDKTEEELVDYLVSQGYLKLPEFQPLDFE